MKRFYAFLSAVALMFLFVPGISAQEISASDMAGEWYFKASYSNEEAGISGEKRYVYFTIDYYEENDSLSLVALGEKDAMKKCGGTVMIEDGQVVICQTVDIEGAESGEGYAYYMGNNESWGHIHLTPLSADKFVITDGITLVLNNFADAYEIAPGGKLYRVGTPEDPDVEPVVDLAPYAGQYYMTADVNGEGKTVTFTIEHNADANKLYLRGMGYENKETACDDDDYEVTYRNGTISLPVVFSSDFSLSLYGGSFTQVTKNKFVVSEEITGVFDMFDDFKVPAEAVIRRAGTVEEPWETIGLEELAGSYKVTCRVMGATMGSDEIEEEPEEVTGDLYFTLAYDNGTLSIVSIGEGLGKMVDIDMPLTQDEGTLDGSYYFGMEGTVSGAMMENFLLYIKGKDELVLSNGLDFFNSNTFVDFVVDAETQAVAVRVNEIPNGIGSVKENNAEREGMYDLMGRRILAPAKGQIYILGGKKYICK